MSKNINRGKIINAIFLFLISVSHSISATETDRIRAEVNRILEQFYRNMEEYYQRTRIKRTVVPAAVKKPNFIETLETKKAKPEQLNEILEYCLEDKREIAKTAGQSVVSFADEMQTNVHLVENLGMLAESEQSRTKFLDTAYENYGKGLLSPKKGIPEVEAQKAHKLFNDAYQELKTNPRDLSADELRNGARPFPSAVSRYGNYMLAAKDRLVLEEKLRDPTIDEKIKNLIKAAYLVDLAKKGSFILPRNPQKHTVYSFQDAKTSDIAAANPNYIAHILADAYSPGGGMLKGTALQEETTLRAARDIQLALYVLATAGIYPLQTYQALTLGNYVFSAMIDNREGEGDAPLKAEDYVQIVLFKLDALVKAAILQAQSLNDTQPKTLILGGAGCGAFKNDPRFVAHVFYHILKKYHGYFDKVIFGVSGGDKELKVKGDSSFGLKYQPFKDYVEKLNQEL